MKERYFPDSDERYFEKVLSNGLRVRVIKRPKFAKKFAFLAVNFGSADQKFTHDGVQSRVPAGIAHYLEHKMFDMPNSSAMEQFAAFGGSNNAFTNYSMTAYYVECTEHFEENLQTLLEMVTTPYFTEESVEKERGIIAQEIKMYEDSADSAVYEALFALMYPDHPISAPIAGTVASIEDITAEQLYACHKAFYDPSDMLLCVVGDVDEEQVAALAESHTPKTKPKQIVRDYGLPKSLHAQSGRTEKQMEVSMPTFAIGFACEPMETAAQAAERDVIGDLAAEVLAGESSALYQKLYDQGIIDADFSADYEYIRGASLLEFSGDSEEPDSVLQALLDEAERIVREGIDGQYFERLRRSMLGRRLRDLDSFESTCYRMSAYHFENCEYLDSISIIQNVRKEQVVELLKQTIRTERAAISVIYPN